MIFLNLWALGDLPCDEDKRVDIVIRSMHQWQDNKSRLSTTKSQKKIRTPSQHINAQR
ncbi:hypothetical protein LIA77_01008 [Sarocladium implicatum]|nr:hypothetical protein LIA77_01008 [Sarocladium implicatum]